MSNHPYTFNLKKTEEEDETKDPAFIQGQQMGMEMVAFFLGLLTLPFVIWLAWNISMPSLISCYQLVPFSWSLYSE